MNVSRPQHRMYPVEKCGKPADIVGNRWPAATVGGRVLGLNLGKSAESLTAINCTEPSAVSLQNGLPFLMKLCTHENIWLVWSLARNKTLVQILFIRK